MAGDLAAVAGGEIEADLVADSRAAKRGPGAGEHHGDAVAGAARVSAPRAGPPSAGLVLVNHGDAVAGAARISARRAVTVAPRSAMSQIGAVPIARLAFIHP
ncbi:hypothetical protein Air01nite_08280 [Asanoa iriomotensis]|uniref:Uncharacterized protein n=1 Tax=Asanoa iriomotensis TaxID=234613 RepID=A0ABQ4BW20_9ACTN|nr:hypothetical protein Air01nite_08280 [Asanoa iriomotensis]